MSKNFPIEKSFYSYKGKLPKGKLLPLLGALFLTGGLTFALTPMVHADMADLEGTPEISPGCTVFKATVEPGQTYPNVYGVRDNTDSTSYGEVTINGGTVTGTVYGCRAISGDALTKASCNKVTSTDSTVATMYGGYAYGGSHNASVHQNIVTINGGSVTMYVYGGNADGSTLSVTGNKVIINHASIGKTVYGGCAFNTASWLSMLRNEVTINGGTVNGSVYGGYASGSATASNSNTVTIEGGAHIKGSVYGGYALSSNSDAKNNTVYIVDGTIDGHIYGGIGRNATGNTVVLYGGDLTQADLYGYSDGRKSHSANTLEVWGRDISIRSAQNFENYYFVVPKGMVNQADRYMLRSATPVNMSGTNVGVAMQNGTTLNIGDKINLIDKTEATPACVSLVGKELKGGTLFTNYDFTLSTIGDAHTLVATATSEPYEKGERQITLGSVPPPQPAGQADPEAKAIVEGQAASVALLAEGNEFASGQALSDARASASAAAAEGEGIAAFATFGGGRSRYATGSHVNMHSTDFIAGLAKEFKDSKQDMLLGAFFEMGRGNYSSYNHFDLYDVRGDGNAHYYGGGLMFQLEPSQKQGLYLQAIGRAGSMSNDWSTNNYIEPVAYATNHSYYGAAATIGYEGKLSKNYGYDLYGKFMWTHQNGDDADIQGEKLQFQDIDSVKTRFGARLSYDGCKAVKPFIGLAWEREFKGEARAKVDGYEIDRPSLKGNSGLLELGVSYKPQSKSNWQLDLTATGYTGARRGVAGQAQFSWKF